jgi:adenine deaminase
MQSFPPYGDTIGSVVVKHVNGNFVDVISGAIYPACVNFYEGDIVRIDRKMTAPDQYILPGLIDSHVHVESSHLSPYRYAEQAILHGTTAVVADPSPASATAGPSGLDYMVEAARATPLKVHFTVPSDIPGLGWQQVRSLLSRNDFVGLGEVTDHEGLIEDEQGIVSKLEVAHQEGKRIDGHAPGLKGFRLERYIMGGVTSDHESLTAKEAEEKHRKGMTIALRESSASRDMDALMPFARRNPFLYATDHLRARDLVDGHIDQLLRRAVEGGIDPVQAVRAATMWPAQHYGLEGGVLQVDAPAHITVVSDLRTFNVLETWIDGDLVARNGELLYMGSLPMPVAPLFPTTRLSEIDVRATGRVANVKVMHVNRHGEVAWGQEQLPVVDGSIVADPTRDVLYMVWSDPTRDWSLRVSFVKGFELRGGALATSEVGKFGGVLSVATTLTGARDAMNEVISCGGGSAAILDREMALLPLPVAGLMSDLPAREVAARELELMQFTRLMGCPMDDPFLTMASMGPFLPAAFQVERTVMSMGA